MCLCAYTVVWAHIWTLGLRPYIGWGSERAFSRWQRCFRRPNQWTSGLCILSESFSLSFTLSLPPFLSPSTDNIGSSSVCVCKLVLCRRFPWEAAGSTMAGEVKLDPLSLSASLFVLTKLALTACLVDGSSSDLEACVPTEKHTALCFPERDSLPIIQPLITHRLPSRSDSSLCRWKRLLTFLKPYQRGLNMMAVIDAPLLLFFWLIDKPENEIILQVREINSRYEKDVGQGENVFQWKVSVLTKL